ncbi:glycoside hydrolase family 43 protein [Luteimonas viscosa]|uniref:Glycoside hydrolase family 43 protein n=1 Tax=Luteimonas viscosa TaxID=1132694 RepID=A0A5D4XQC2_9GAMM|nr:glycoside hydrolase family 43 protein [Luteimonas viscosa]TYT26868.1 glycoside hydrolase family 43 protein [Luteimonas viscosa]
MIMKRCLAFLAGCLLATGAHAGEALFTEVAYTGDDDGPAPGATQFRNPVIAGFHPDPSAIRVGDDYYLVTSSFGYFPGLPVFHSTDLVSWRQIGNAIDRPEQMPYGDGEELTRGLFAATISHHDGTFYIANTCFYCPGRGMGNFVVTARDPAGPWSDPHWLDIDGIDPSLFFDDDGRAWLVNNGVPEGEMRYDGHRAIFIQEFDAETLSLVGPRLQLVDAGVDPASNPEHVEGPHVFRHDGWYYLTAAEGGTGEQHAQMIWRSRAVTGPYEAWSGNPTLTQRDLDPARTDPVTSTGHAQFVRAQDDSWWAVFLATRPYRGNQYNLGRETFLLPVQWREGWPVILARGERVPAVLERPALPRDAATPPTTGPMAWTERFGAGTLPPQWVMLDPPKTAWFTTGDGLRITPAATPLGAHGQSRGQPAYVAHRLLHHHATLATTLDAAALDAGEFAGMALLQNERYHYVAGLERDERGAALVLLRRAGKDEPEGGRELARIRLSGVPAQVSLRFRLAAPRLDVDYALAPGDWKPLAADLDASLLSVDTAGGFIGNTFGPYAVRRDGHP